MSLLAALLLTAVQCTPEHAAMGHCKMTPAAKPKPVARPKPKPVAKPRPRPAAAARAKPHPAVTPRQQPSAGPVCTPEHAAMGHCQLPQQPAAPAPSSPAPPLPTPPATDPCTPEHAAMGHCRPAAATPAAPPSSAPPPAARSGPDHAADAIWGADAMAPARRAVHAEHGGFTDNRILLDRLEYRAAKGRDGYAVEGEAWFGGDYDRLWLKFAADGTFGEPLESAELQALYSRAINPWFNLQGGVRHDFGHGPDRTQLALGIQGLAPYWFEIDAAAFLSTKGELTARVEAEYDQRITNQLILQPRVELGLSAQDITELRVGAGLTEVEAGLRLRYEFVPEFAPYLGVEWERSVGRTADHARAAGERTGGWSFVAGVRAWF